MKQTSLYLIGVGLVLLTGCSSGSDAPSNTTTQSALPVGAAQALPQLSITTDNGAEVTSREIYVPGDYVLKDESRTILLQGRTEIKGRGHSTWDMPKKPYHIKLATSSSLLGMPANRHWALLANYADKTLLRNDLTFQISQWMGMEYTPRSTFVEVELNGTYLGIYQLTEHIRIAPDRVNIPQLKIGDTNFTGGYLIEIDETRGEVFCYDSPRFGTAMPFCLKDPETLLNPGWEALRAYIEGYISQAEAAIFSDDFANPVTGYASYIDVDSLVQYYLVNELVRNVDGDLRRSAYLYKKRDGKLTFGPVWDFDLAAGNADYIGCWTDDWYVRRAPWFTRLFEDPAFAAKVKDKWNQLKASGSLNELFQHIDRRATYLSHVQVRNFQEWPILSTWVWPNCVVTGSYQGEVTALKTWLQGRIDWMDSQFNP